MCSLVDCTNVNVIVINMQFHKNSVGTVVFCTSCSVLYSVVDLLMSTSLSYQYCEMQFHKNLCSHFVILQVSLGKLPYVDSRGEMGTLIDVIWGGITLW